jgi:hypothetical protein
MTQRLGLGPGFKSLPAVFSVPAFQCRDNQSNRVTSSFLIPSNSLLIYRSMNLAIETMSQSHVATDGQSATVSWYRATYGATDQMFVTALILWGALSGERSNRVYSITVK